MAKEYSRTQRVADYLRRELAQLIQFEVRNPKVGMASITDVEVSRDLSHAKVFITIVDKDTAEQAEENIKALNSAQGFLRSALAKDSSMRTVPRLHFVFDASVGRGQHLSALIEEAIASDAGHQDDVEKDD
ncbi:30S ribosome-binding factor [Sinobacterium norvegicum]|uniref:Ribosome-binding factor A n=1 Tax=Sinobacterium norvegicum TaxID=1641715 RepID=A0ABM9AGI3_9GAMM|nr:30S ribosome-binding factor RbfA [Sinobacterium norvegicum]CAH0992242.1 30S ribosome-binding factor [Sinobacterium norvegicum]